MKIHINKPEGVNLNVFEGDKLVESRYFPPGESEVDAAFIAKWRENHPQESPYVTIED